MNFNQAFPPSKVKTGADYRFGTWVVMLESDLAIAIRGGKAVQAASVNIPEQLCSRHEPEYAHCMGDVAEAVFCKWYGIPYQTQIGQFRKPDIGFLNVEVKATGHNENGLKVPIHQHPETRMVGVIVPSLNCKQYRITGWIFAGDGQKAQWRDDPNNKGKPAFFVPQSKLRPIEELKHLLDIEQEDRA